jgi:hypothetical protein
VRVHEVSALCTGILYRQGLAKLLAATDAHLRTFEGAIGSL